MHSFLAQIMTSPILDTSPSPGLRYVDDSPADNQISPNEHTGMRVVNILFGVTANIDHMMGCIAFYKTTNRSVPGIKC